MQNSIRQSSTKNYSKNSTATRRNKAKQRRSIFSVPEPVEPQRIRRIKNRRNMVRNYREKIRDIYHQTDYLVSWKEDDLSCFIRPIEQTSSFAFFEKSTRSNFSTLSAAYAGDTYSKYKDITLPYNSTESQPSNNFTESSNLVSIPTGAFSNSLYGVHNENTNQNQYDLNETKQDQSDLNNNKDEEQIQSQLSDIENEEQIKDSFNDEENEEQNHTNYYNEEARINTNEAYEDQNEDYFNNSEGREEPIQGDFNYGANEERNQATFANGDEDPWVIDDNNNNNQNDDETMEQPTNFMDEFSAIQATNQTEQQNIQSKYDFYTEKDIEEDSNDEDLDVNLSVNVIVYEEEEEVNDQFYPFQNENVESIFVRVNNLPINDQYAPLFVTFQHYAEKNIPIGHQYIFNINQNEETSVFNFSNVNETDIIEALVFINDDEVNPTLVSGIQLPVRSVNWNYNGIQIFDLISADDLRSGFNTARGDAGTIELVFKVL